MRLFLSQSAFLKFFHFFLFYFQHEILLGQLTSTQPESQGYERIKTQLIAAGVPNQLSINIYHNHMISGVSIPSKESEFFNVTSKAFTRFNL